MLPRSKLKRILAPAAGFRNAVITHVIGLCFLSLGILLSFRDPLFFLVDAVNSRADRLFSAIEELEQRDVARHLLGGALLVLGFYLALQGLRFGLRHIFQTVNDGRGGLADTYRRRLMLAQGPRIVAIGGGTGLSTLLRGLKQHSSNITAIVTVTDDGGSSGRLSQEKGMIPPGDIRNCLVALADAEKSMTDLFQHRFTKESGSLSGHSLGNLLIAALVDQAKGDFEAAVETASDVLAIRGRVIPSTLEQVHLRAIMEDGSEIEGETAIAENSKRIRRIFLNNESAEPRQEALDAILNADLICIGPGSVFTSVIPNLLINGLAKALLEAPGKKVYICNVMTQRGESDQFSASEHVTAIRANVDQKVFDYVMVNTAVPSPSALEKYREAGQFFVDADLDRIRAMGYRVLAGDFMNESDLVRHDPMRVAQMLIQLHERK
jgi:uncharacterized cofD-like protein